MGRRDAAREISGFYSLGSRYMFEERKKPDDPLARREGEVRERAG